MKHSTPWRDELVANAGSVISGNSESSRANVAAWMTLTPETELEADEKWVDVPECKSCQLHKSIVILNVCKKSNPRIGLGT